MTTETAPDPIIHDWSDDLEEELVEAGMEPPQAKAYARAFELGMARVLSVMATKEELLLTKQELQKSIDDLRNELHRDIAQLRDDLRREMGIRGRYLIFTMTIGFGILAALMGAILSKL